MVKHKNICHRYSLQDFHEAQYNNIHSKNLISSRVLIISLLILSFMVISYCGIVMQHTHTSNVFDRLFPSLKNINTQYKHISILVCIKTLIMILLCLSINGADILTPSSIQVLFFIILGFIIITTNMYKTFYNNLYTFTNADQCTLLILRFFITDFCIILMAMMLFTLLWLMNPMLMLILVSALYLFAINVFFGGDIGASKELFYKTFNKITLCDYVKKTSDKESQTDPILNK